MPEPPSRPLAWAGLASWAVGLGGVLALDGPHELLGGWRGVAALAALLLTAALAVVGVRRPRTRAPDAALVVAAAFAGLWDPVVDGAAAILLAVAAGSAILFGHALVRLDGRLAGPAGPAGTRRTQFLLARTAAGTALVAALLAGTLTAGPRLLASAVSARWAESTDAAGATIGALGLVLAASMVLGLRLVFWGAAARAGRTSGAAPAPETDSP